MVTTKKIRRVTVINKVTTALFMAAALAGTVHATEKALWQIGTFDASSGEFKSQGIDYADPQSDPVFIVGDLSTVWLLAFVRETDVPKLNIGEALDFEVLAYPDRVFTARISWIAPGIDPNTHRLPVRADVANPDGALKPMMFASFSIITGDPVTMPAISQSPTV